MRLACSPRIDRIPVVHRPPVGGIHGIESVDRAQSRHEGKTVVSDAEQCQRMISSVKDALAVDFVLPAVFQLVQKSVSEGA